MRAHALFINQRYHPNAPKIVSMACRGHRPRARRPLSSRRPSKNSKVRFSPTSPTSHLLTKSFSAFFARPISIALIYSSTFIYPSPSQPAVPLTLPNPAALVSASPSTPITQERQVHLQCAGKTVCIATSTVRITSPTCARLFLEEKYAIGQMFTRLDKVPEFELVSVGFGRVTGDGQEKTSGDLFSRASLQRKQLWRKYRLAIPDFECDILEVFPDRGMFVTGESWLDNTDAYPESYLSTVDHTKLRGSTNGILLMAFLGLFTFEGYMFFAGRAAC